MLRILAEPCDAQDFRQLLGTYGSSFSEDRQIQAEEAQGDGRNYMPSIVHASRGAESFGEAQMVTMGLALRFCHSICLRAGSFPGLEHVHVHVSSQTCTVPHTAGIRLRSPASYRCGEASGNKYDRNDTKRTTAHSSAGTTLIMLRAVYNRHELNTPLWDRVPARILVRRQWKALRDEMRIKRGRCVSCERGKQ